MRRGKLDAGDYALDGDTRLSIERKSLDDFLGTISSGWERFERELERMANQRHVARCIVVEGSIADIANGKHNHSRLTLGFVMKRIGRLTLEGVSILFAEDHNIAAITAYGILRERNKDLEEIYGADQSNSGTTGTGKGVGVQKARQQMDNPECPSGIGAKMHRQRDSGIRAEARGPVGTGRGLEEKPV